MSNKQINFTETSVLLCFTLLKEPNLIEHVCFPDKCDDGKPDTGCQLSHTNVRESCTDAKKQNETESHHRSIYA